LSTTTPRKTKASRRIGIVIVIVIVIVVVLVLVLVIVIVVVVPAGENVKVERPVVAIFNLLEGI